MELSTYLTWIEVACRGKHEFRTFGWPRRSCSGGAGSMMLRAGGTCESSDRLMSLLLALVLTFH